MRQTAFALPTRCHHLASQSNRKPETSTMHVNFRVPFGTKINMDEKMYWLHVRCLHASCSVQKCVCSWLMIGLHMLIVFAFLALPDNHAFTTGLLPCLSPCTNGPTIVMSKPDSSSRCSFSIPKFGCFKMRFPNHMF